MAKGEGKIIERRITNAYMSSVISISLVLLLVGVACLLLVNAKGVSNYFKEHMTVSVILHGGVSEEDALDYMRDMERLPFVRSGEYISVEQGTEEMKAILGEDFLTVFSSSPIPVSIDFTITADYVSADSLALVKADLSRSPLVDEVSYQTSIVDALNDNIGKISLVLLVFIALLLFISFVLINNTLRLSFFSRRFTIHTMRLVGATRGFIQGPFIAQSVFQGVIAALFATAMLLGLLFALRSEFTLLFEIFTMPLLLEVVAIVLIVGVVLCVLSTYLVVNKLVSLRRSELYF
ncbi:MAG: permease-like cell division protein FtsX [Bacteroidales bacterium]|nr:permease-like cell division protein FtsX [Bacteroidales bacterium]